MTPFEFASDFALRQSAAKYIKVCALPVGSLRMSKMMVRFVSGGALMAALFTVPLLAQTAADAQRARSALMKEIGAAARTIGQQAQAEAPDMTAVKGAAAVLTSAAAKLPGLFPAGSGPESGVPTQSRAEIWTMPAEFKVALDNFSKASAVVGVAGDAAALKAAAPAVQQSCGGCHRSFRNAPARTGAPVAPAPAPAN